MAHDLTEAALEAVDHYHTRVGDIVAEWDEIFTIKTDQREFTDYKPVDLSGITAYTLQNAAGDAPAADDLVYAGKAYQAPAREKRGVFTDHQLAKNPTLLMEYAEELVDAFLVSVGTLTWGLLAALDTTVHPENGLNYTADGGGTVYLADEFATPVDQDNITTNSLGATGISIAAGMLRGYKNKNGFPADFRSGRLALVVHSDKEDEAADYAARDKEIYDGSGLQGSTARTAQRVFVNPFQADADDWLLVNLDRNPFGLWMPLMPYLRAQPFPGAGRIELYSGFEAGTFIKPFEGGFIFNKPA